MTIQRDRYLQQLAEGQRNHLIKIVTGICRCGKSYLLLNLFPTYLQQHGINKDHILKIDLEDIRNARLRSPMNLVDHIDSRMVDQDTYYILLDEVQHIEHFEDVLNSYLKIENADVYVTGSNSKFLSSDIVTEFRGRGDEIHMFPLSFAEFYSAKGGEKEEAWREYFSFGGLPQIAELNSDKKKAQYLRNLYYTVYKRDLIERNRIAKEFEFDELVKVLASSIGSPCNPTKLSKTFKSVKNTDLSPATIHSYLSHLEDAFLIERAQRYEVKGKKYINSLSKIYFTDLGLRNALLDFRQQEENHIMENVIYNELRMRGFQVDTGIVETTQRNTEQKTERRQYEVDFVANLGSKRYYIQSALTIPDREKEAQETASFKNIKDNFKKIIVVRNNVKPWYTQEGFLVLSLFDFLLDPSSMDY